MSVNVLEPNEPNKPNDKMCYHANLHIILMENGESSDMELDQLNTQDKNTVENFVRESFGEISKLHGELSFSNIKMQDDYFKVTIRISDQELDFSFAHDLITEYFMSQTVQNKFPKLKGKEYQFQIELEED